MEIKIKPYRLHHQLNFRIIVPILVLMLLLGVGLYSLVLKSVSNFANHRIQEDLDRNTREIYNICDETLQQILMGGMLKENESTIRVKKGKAIWEIEEYIKNNKLQIIIYSEGNTKIFPGDTFSPEENYFITHTSNTNRVFFLKYGEKTFYARRFEFEFWNWHLLLFKDVDVYGELIEEVQRAYVATGIILIIASLLLMFYLKRLIKDPIKAIITSIQTETMPQYKGTYEFEFLSDTIRETTEAHHNSLNTLKHTQKHLVQSEKMAALGELVAGISHEINTPVGIGVTAASSLQDHVKHISHLYQNEKMTKSDLEDFLDMSSQTSQMILNNLKRAAELIQSFKQVAVDQTSEAKRNFNVKDYLEEIITSLGPRLKKTGLQCEIICAENIEIESYPGLFSQIITNFVINSIMHGYDPNEAGILKIRVEIEDNQLVLEFKDDGKGIPEPILSKIFDPFFTTKRGEGGSGLGLHIAYNLITQTLQGNIQCHSKIGEGTMFSVRWPIFEHEHTIKKGSG